MSRTLVMGDVHGAHKAMVHVLEKANFDPVDDTLIFLGDYCDGWYETKEVIEELMGFPNLIKITGNHDEWFCQWVMNGYKEHSWLHQGGSATVESFDMKAPIGKMRNWILNHRRKSYIDYERNYAFVHGGIGVDLWHLNDPFVFMDVEEATWDRDLFCEAARRHVRADVDSKIVTAYEEVYIGHTTTERFSAYPARGGNVWMMDQGGGWSGYQSVMDIDTKEAWISDKVSKYYPGVKGRG